MIVPSGKGSLPSRKAVIATGFPSFARMSLTGEPTRATEIKGQSRYPAGGSIPFVSKTRVWPFAEEGPTLATRLTMVPTPIAIKEIAKNRFFILVHFFVIAYSKQFSASPVAYFY